MKFAAILAASALVLAASEAAADSLVTSDGNTLLGELVQISDGVVVFRTELAGQVITPAKHVVSLTTRKPHRISTATGTVVGRFARQDGRQIIATAEGSTAAIDLMDVVSTVSLAPSTGARVAPTSQPVTAVAGVAVMARSGDDDYIAPYARLSLAAERERYYFQSSTFFELASSDAFPRTGSTRLEWQFPNDRLLQPQITLAFERDTAHGLAIRGSLALGYTAALLDSAAARAGVSAGLEVAVERWDVALQGDARSEAGALSRLRDLGYYADERRNVEEAGFAFSVDYSRKLIDRLTFAQTFRLNPSITQPGEVRAQAQSAFVLPLTERMNLMLDLQIDYDSAPELESADEWRSYIGAGFEIGF